MKLNCSLKTRLTLLITITVLVTVVLTFALSQLVSREQFTNKDRLEQINELVHNLSLQYDTESANWNLAFVNSLGLNALSAGFSIQVSDAEGQILWDAKTPELTTDKPANKKNKERIQERYLSGKGEFFAQAYPLLQSGEKVGHVVIRAYAPADAEENNFVFLGTLNKILLAAAILALFPAVIFGRYLAGRLHEPISKAVAMTRQLAAGNYVTQSNDLAQATELNQLLIALSDLSTKLAGQEKLRKQLIADLVHELRTPLTTTSAYIETMLEGLLEPTKEHLQTCYEEIHRLNRLVLDLENLTKVESEYLKLHKESFALTGFFDSVLHSLEVEIEKKKLCVQKQFDCAEVYADWLRLSQVIYNLLTNAIKYSWLGGQIKISTSQNGDNVILCIEDKGKGIAADDMPNIFERFYQAKDSQGLNTGGSGLGLAIVKAIVAAHEGRIEVQSNLNCGTTVQIFLPKNETC